MSAPVISWIPSAEEVSCGPDTVEAVALFYLLIETAHLRGEDPGRYLLRAALAAIENPCTVTLPFSSD